MGEVLQFAFMAEPPNRLLELRRARDWSQQELADRVGISKMQVSRLERGVGELSLTMMRRLAEVFEVTPAELLEEDDNPLNLTDDERELLERFREADPATRAQLQKVADVMLPWKGPEQDAA